MQDREFYEAVKELALSDAFEELLNRLEAKHTSDWKNSVPIANDKREHHWHMVSAINELREEIRNIIQGEKISNYNRRLHSKLT